MRLDAYLTANGFAKSRERSKELIKAGQVAVNGITVTKSSYEVVEASCIEITGNRLKYVGRGGLKLEKAIAEFGISLSGRVCIDVGASTGGFTDCMLQNGAVYVYAVDVGHGQLDERLAADSRVHNIEGTNIKDLSYEDFPKRPDFISADVSFVSIKQILPKIKELLPESGEAAVLIKPQFEAGRAAVGKRGIVKDRKVHERVLEDIISFCFGLGLAVMKVIHSPISGGSGNIEYLAYIKAYFTDTPREFDCKKIVSSAFDELK